MLRRLYEKNRSLTVRAALCSVVFSIGSTQARAEDAPQNTHDNRIKIFADFQTSFALGDDVETRAVNTTGGPSFVSSDILDTELDRIYGGTIGIVAPLDNFQQGAGPAWSLGITGRYDAGETNENYGPVGTTFVMLPNSDSGTDVGVDATIEQKLGLGDLELRYRADDSTSGLNNVVWKAGLRVGYHFENSTVSDASASANPRTSVNKTEFLGVGPHIGTEFSMPVSDGVNIDFGIGGGLLFGQHERFRQVTFADGSSNAFGLPYLETQSETRVIPTLDAVVALRTNMTENVSLSIGVKLDYFFGIRDEFLSNNTDVVTPFSFDTDVDQYYFSPFVRLTSHF
ncbi:MAG: Lpg1974 family pore-forming outer membrane protein [Rhizobiaceae bacterium]